MKILRWIFLAIIVTACGAWIPYSNTNGWYGDTLPVPLKWNGYTISAPVPIKAYLAAGYRTNTIIDVPIPTNIVADTYLPVDIDGTNAELTVLTSHDWVIAASNAAAFAASNAAAAYAQNLLALSNQVQQTILGTNPNYAVAYATAWAAATAGVKAGSWATMAAATNAIIQKAYGQIK